MIYAYKVNSTSSLSFSSVLDNISFIVNEGDSLGVIVPSGAGKATLFRCMLGLLKDYRGETEYSIRTVEKTIVLFFRD
jgi:ABC-type oligopeptide transport system ATPase subunit